MQIKKLGVIMGVLKARFFAGGTGARDVREFGVGKKHMKFSR